MLEKRTMIRQETINFLANLRKNNNREWFQENKRQYEAGLENFKSFVEAVRLELNKVDKISKAKVYRIYRDLRFTKDKTPYKRHFAAHFTRAGKYRRGGFYIQVSPDNSMVGGGFWKPNREDLRFIRDGIISDAEPLRSALSKPELKKRFGGLKGKELKTGPRGYDKKHPAIDLLKKKQFLLSCNYSLKVVLGKDFYKRVVKDFELMLPVFQAMTEYLVYDGNGIER